MSTLKVNSIESSSGSEVDINSALGSIPSVNVSGTLTATNAVITGDLTVQGTTTTLDTNLVEVDRVEVGANSTNPGIAVTQSGSGPAAYFNGSVGIGTNNPQEDLHIGSNSPYILLDDYDNARKWKLKGTAWFAIEDTTAGEDRIRILSNGNIGIGTDNPARALDVEGNAQIINSGGTAFITGRDRALDTYGAIGFADADTIQITAGSGGSRNVAMQFRTASSGTETARMTLDSSGRLLVGTTTTLSTTLLQVEGKSNDGTAHGGIFLRRGSAPGTNDALGYVLFGDNGSNAPIEIGGFRDGGTWTAGSSMPTRLVFSTTADGASSPTERMRIDSAGRLLLGTSSTRNNYYGGTTYTPRIQNEATSLATSMISNVTNSNDSYGAYLILGKSRGTSAGSYTVVQDNDTLGNIDFHGADGTHLEHAGRISCAVDGTPGNNDMPARLAFHTCSDGTTGTQERMRINSNGGVKIAHDGSYYSADNFSFSVSASENANTLIGRNTNASFSTNLMFYYTSRAGSSAYSFLRYASNAAGDTEFNLRGDGNAYADGSWNGGGADYAEYFEWSDGNTTAEDRRGISVVLDGDKMREAVAGEEPIGVISGNPSVVGDADIDRWKGKYLRDDFGTYIQEDYEVEDEDGNTVVQQRRKLNPDYNPDIEYVSREDRSEWDCVGLMGKLRIRKGQVTGARWIKMRDVSDNVEEWLVR